MRKGATVAEGKELAVSAELIGAIAQALGQEGMPILRLTLRLEHNQFAQVEMVRYVTEAESESIAEAIRQHGLRTDDPLESQSP